MKKTYITPATTAINLFGEDVMVSASKVIKVDGSQEIDGGDARSGAFEWSTDSWDDEE